MLLQRLVDGNQIGSGLVSDPCLVSRQRELMGEAHSHGLETILDPRTLELSTAGGILRGGITDLPWAGTDGLHTPAMLAGPTGAFAVQQIAAWVEKHGLTGVLAPTHYIASEPDPWLPVDRALTQQLRAALDERDLRDVPIYYPLIIRGATINHPGHRAALMTGLTDLPIDALWLRVHPFGTPNAGPLALRRYLETCRAMHALELPLVAEHSGTVGVALLAFGAVGGIESGVTLAEVVDLDRYLKTPDPGSTPFSHRRASTSTRSAPSSPSARPTRSSPFAA